MVKKLIRKNAYQCQECKLIYSERKWAEKCEKWCSKHGTCNILITKHVMV